MIAAPRRPSPMPEWAITLSWIVALALATVLTIWGLVGLFRDWRLWRLSARCPVCAEREADRPNDEEAPRPGSSIP